jgi:hypothetical protein
MFRCTWPVLKRNASGPWMCLSDCTCGAGP